MPTPLVSSACGLVTSFLAPPAFQHHGLIPKENKQSIHDAFRVVYTDSYTWKNNKSKANRLDCLDSLERFIKRILNKGRLNVLHEVFSLLNSVEFIGVIAIIIANSGYVQVSATTYMFVVKLL